jgi:hypothetical protein
MTNIYKVPFFLTFLNNFKIDNKKAMTMDFS